MSANHDWFEKDFYEVLGVPHDADADAVKKAYRKLARSHHPDANAGNAESERKFKEIGEAYAVLSDPEQRKQYDAVRAMARGGARFTPGGGGAGGFEDLLGGLFGTPNPGQFRQGGAGPGLEDLLGGLFGGSPGAGGPTFRSPAGPRPGTDRTAEVTLTFQQSVDGAQLNLKIPDDRGGASTVTAKVPAGIKDGQKVRLRGKGHPGDPGAAPGDLWVTVHVQPHPIFTRDGEDLKVTVPITFAEAALGGQVEVPSIDGSTLRLKVPAGTPSGRVLRAKGRGISGAKRQGDLLVTVAIEVPQRLSDEARAAVEAFAQATAGDDPRAALLARARKETP